MRKKEDAVAGGGKAKAGGGGGGGGGAGNVSRERVSVSAFLNSLDKAKEDQPVKKKPAVSAKVPKKAPAAATSAYGDIDLPPEDEEDEGMDSEEEAALALKRATRKGLDLTVTDKTVKKKRRRRWWRLMQRSWRRWKR